MALITKQDTNGTKPLLAKGRLGYDDYAAGGDEGRIYVGTGSTNIAIAKKSDVTTVAEDLADVINGVTQVDGRDLSVDGAKLDGIESGATADQVASEVPVTASGSLTSTDVQSALQELQTDVDSRVLTSDIGSAVQAYDVNTTIQGNTFNGANQLVQLDGTGALPAVDGSNVTGIVATSTAVTTTYNNADSTLVAANVKAGLDELDSKVINGDKKLPFTFPSDANATLTDEENEYGSIEIQSGVITADRTIIINTREREMLITNSSDYNITVKTPSGTGVALKRGEVTHLRCDGTNVIKGKAITYPFFVGANNSAIRYEDGTIIGETDNGKYTIQPNGEVEIIIRKARGVTMSTPTGSVYYPGASYSDTYPISNLTEAKSIQITCGHSPNGTWAVNLSDLAPLTVSPAYTFFAPANIGAVTIVSTVVIKGSIN